MIVEITSWRPTVAFRKPAIPAQSRAGERRGADREQDVRQRGHAREADADPVRDDEADEVLALPADVEHPAAEGEGDREAGEDQRRRLEQRLGEVVRATVLTMFVVRDGRSSSGPAPLKMSL